jgi:hypothetical protein
MVIAKCASQYRNAFGQCKEVNMSMKAKVAASLACIVLTTSVTHAELTPTVGLSLDYNDNSDYFFAGIGVSMEF